MHWNRFLYLHLVIDSAPSSTNGTVVGSGYFACIALSLFPFAWPSFCIIDRISRFFANNQIGKWAIFLYPQLVFGQYCPVHPKSDPIRILLESSEYNFQDLVCTLKARWFQMAPILHQDCLVDTFCSRSTIGWTIREICDTPHADPTEI